MKKKTFTQNICIGLAFKIKAIDRIKAQKWKKTKKHCVNIVTCYRLNSCTWSEFNFLLISCDWKTVVNGRKYKCINQKKKQTKSMMLKNNEEHKRICIHSFITSFLLFYFLTELCNTKLCQNNKTHPLLMILASDSKTITLILLNIL